MKALEIDDRLESLISELEFKDARGIIKDSLLTKICYTKAAKS